MSVVAYFALKEKEFDLSHLVFKIHAFQTKPRYES
jgi:hypothetical protein